MKIAAVQINCRLNESERNLRRALQCMDREKADLYVLPELFSTGYLFSSRAEVVQVAEVIPAGETCQSLIAACQKRKCHLVAGLAERAGDKVFNASVLIGPSGHLATYRKIHLFDEEKKWFDPGDRPFAVHDIGAAKIGLMICFDWMFPESMRSLALLGCQIVCHSANLVLPYCQQAITTRCLENGVFCVTANRTGYDQRGTKRLQFTGHSQITGPRGQVLAQASKLLEEVIVVDISPQAADDKWLNSANHLIKDRRLDLYQH